MRFNPLRWSCFRALPWAARRALFILLFAGTGCGSELEQQGLGPIEIPISRERVRPDERRKTLGVRVNPEILVRESVHEKSGLTYDAWVEKVIDESPGQILFQRWQSLRLAPQKYEVRFTYNQVFQDNRIVPGGYAWEVDLRMEWVHPPRILQVEDLDPSMRNQGRPPVANRKQPDATP